MSLVSWDSSPPPPLKQYPGFLFEDDPLERPNGELQARESMVFQK